MPRMTRLVLSRKVGERVVLELKDGTQMCVVVAALRNGDKVRLSFEAPEDVRIWRGELEDFRRGAA